MDSTHRPTHLADLIEQAAARHADHPALIDAATGATLTWAGFDAAVSAEARRLAAEGVVAGDRVVIHCGGPALAVAVAGAMRAGAVAVPVAPGEVAAVAARCAPRVLVADEQASADVTTLGPPDLDARGERLAAVGGGEDLALLLHTSAGRAVCLSHRAVLANRAQAAALRPAPVTPVDRVLLTLPLFHAYGLAAGLFQVCWAGATAVLPGSRPARRRRPGRRGRAAPGEHAGRRARDLPGAARAPGGAAADRAGRAAAVHVRRGAAAAAVGDGVPRGDRAPRRRGLRPDGGRAGGDEHPAGRGRGSGLRGASPAGDRAAARRPRRAAVGGARDGGRGAGRPARRRRRTSRRTTSCRPKSPRRWLLRPGRARTGPGGRRRSAEPSGPRWRPPAGAGITDVRATASRVATDVRAAAERGVAEFRAVAERGVAEFRVAAERAATEVPGQGARRRPGRRHDRRCAGRRGPRRPRGRRSVGSRSRGPNLFSGYWPGGTGGPDADGWFVTADMGFLDGSGALHLVDRSSDLVVVSGFTVYPHQVERVLGELPTSSRRR